MADPQRTRLVLVARAQLSTLAEITRTQRELAAIGLAHQYVVINGVLPIPADHSDPLAAAITNARQQAIAALPTNYVSLPSDMSTSRAPTSLDVDALESLFTTDDGHTRKGRGTRPPRESRTPPWRP